jgi:2-pyrone-4,6-dicarboxylate lactonase
MIDHIGRVDASLGENHQDFQALLHLMEDPKMHMKVSGVDRIVKGLPYTSGIDLAKIMVDRFTEKCVWGTDWPHPNHHHIPQDGMLVDSISQITDTPEKLMHIMVKNPEFFYGFK